jgi:hypothetical protein
VVQYLACQHVLVGRHVFGGLAVHPIVAGSFDPARKMPTMAPSPRPDREMSWICGRTVSPEGVVGLGVDH